MNTFIRFFYEFISIFFDGFISIFKGLFGGIIQMFNIPEYAKLISSYQGNFSAGEKILVVLSVILLVVIMIVIIALLIFLIRKMIRRYDKDINKDSLLSET